jgi:hypothetical protein
MYSPPFFFPLSTEVKRGKLLLYKTPIPTFPQGGRGFQIELLKSIIKRRKYIKESKYNYEEPFPPWGEIERGVDISQKNSPSLHRIERAERKKTAPRAVLAKEPACGAKRG